MTTFYTLKDAISAGWFVYDRYRDGYLVKQFFIGAGWKIGRVVLAKGAAARESAR